MHHGSQYARVSQDNYFTKRGGIMPTTPNWDFLKKPCTWFFDLDDTLAWNCVCYNKPILKFVDRLAVIFNNRVPSPGTIIRLQEDIDAALGKEINPRTGKLYGFSKYRFPDAFALTYKALCEMGFGTYDEKIAEECREIGRGAFDPENYRKMGLVDNAGALLRALRLRGDRIVIVTKGDKEVQDEKIKAYRLEHAVDGVYVVDHKDGSTYIDILIDQHKKRTRPNISVEPWETVVVGNSFASDIVPALQCGMHAIFIPCPTWKAECMDTSKIDQEERMRVREVKEIGEIFQMLR